MNSDTTIDLAARLTPHPEQTLIVEAVEPLGNIQSGDLVLLDRKRAPSLGDIVLDGDSLAVYESGINALGVAYCSIHFLN